MTIIFDHLNPTDKEILAKTKAVNANNNTIENENVNNNQTINDT